MLHPILDLLMELVMYGVQLYINIYKHIYTYVERGNGSCFFSLNHSTLYIVFLPHLPSNVCKFIHRLMVFWAGRQSSSLSFCCFPWISSILIAGAIGCASILYWKSRYELQDSCNIIMNCMLVYMWKQPSGCLKLSEPFLFPEGTPVIRGSVLHYFCMCYVSFGGE